ncbi:MAG: hypothetical protein KC620_09395 [Myxococcales bacterium]|nr:hypothetical protein [Myxococcales bacterium]
MSRLTRPGLCALAALDVLLGVALICWPGAWQEVVHPLAVGTTFYAVQRQGALWLARGLAAAFLVRRSGPLGLAALALAWAVEVPADALLAWRTGDTGPLAAAVYASHALLAIGVASALRRAALGLVLQGAKDAERA